VKSTCRIVAAAGLLLSLASGPARAGDGPLALVQGMVFTRAHGPTCTG
jgi:hypothetical protein